MAGPNPTEVKRLTGSSLTDEEVQPFISLANVTIDSNLSGRGLAKKVLRKIELLLAAHFLTIREGELQSEKIGAAEDRYQNKTRLSKTGVANFYLLSKKSNGSGRTAVDTQ